jgi:hypothetical protein
MVRVGVVGHRWLEDVATSAFVASRCHDYLRSVSADARPVVALSALAAGSDTLFAQAAVALGIPLSAVRPFDSYGDETLLHGAVLVEATCHKANFKLTDLRHADLSGADLTGASFESAKVHGVVLAGATVASMPDHVVDLSQAADGSELRSVGEWISRSG